jgi:nicotinamidase-related amidase
MQYSAFFNTSLHARLQKDRIGTLVVSGAETDVCVLSTICSAVDYGFRIVVAADGVCSSSDRCHDALMVLYTERFTQQLEIADVDTILQSWSPE